MTRLVVYAFGFIVATFAVLWAAAHVFDRVQATRVAYKYVASALTPAPSADLTVTWAAPDAALVRPFTPADASVIGRALQEAWQIHAVAQDSGISDLIADRFTSVAQDRALQSLKDAQAHGGRMIVLKQHATPRFFHKDGSLFQAHVETVVARYVSTDGDTLTTLRLTRESGIATLLHESNGWRLMSWERRTAEPLVADRAPLEGELFGFNYYPAETPWREFWPEFSVDLVAQDFEAMKALNANSVRVFLTRDAFLGQAAQNAVNDLQALLAVADRVGVRVIPTLFDLKQDFGLGTWAQDAEYLGHVLPVLRASPAVAFVDLKNEPDLDFQIHGTAKIIAWLRTMAGLTRDAAPGLPLSIGWSTADHAHRLLDQMDAVTFHDYQSADGAAARLSAVQATAGDRPVYVTEIGDSSFDMLAGFPGSETSQAQRLDQRLQALSSADGVMVWTLHDFPNVDASAVGGSPWVQRLQASFGVLREDGTEKPAADVVRNAFGRRR